MRKGPSGKKDEEKSKSTQNGLRKTGPNRGNPYQIEDNKAAPSAPPQGGGASRRPLGFCCLRFGKDFLCFGLISGAHFGPILIFPPSFSRKGFSSFLGAPIFGSLPLPGVANSANPRGNNLQPTTNAPLLIWSAPRGNQSLNNLRGGGYSRGVGVSLCVFEGRCHKPLFFTAKRGARFRASGHGPL